MTAHRFTGDGTAIIRPGQYARLGDIQTADPFAQALTQFAARSPVNGAVERFDTPQPGVNAGPMNKLNKSSLSSCRREGNIALVRLPTQG